ncbi:alpha/beta-hydrolase [Schizopora paradoxa]|uniref:Alpha/beta-hydrolase n=1 Tax=Schizopora paradoxa TaxID=27342 RepID=A0A0H2RVC7_9AGAM|nr:alpha/beta-hydrolase [Schizopora paradoxa]
MSKLNGVDKNLFDELRALHADEFASLQKRLKGAVDEWNKSWWQVCFDITMEYFKFVGETWFKCVWMCFFFPLTMVDRLATIILSFASCAIITVLMFWCLFCSLPSVTSTADWVLSKFFGGLSIVNIAYPTIFRDLKGPQVQAAHEYLSKAPTQFSSLESRRTRVFNLDAAKVLLQCAALMYERTGKQTRKTARAAAENKVHTTATEFDHGQAGNLIRQECGQKSADAVNASLHEINDEEITIKKIAMENLGLQYYPVSECNSLGSAFCALFWDPTDTFIIVAFKGTNPTDFKEWRTDFTFQMAHAREWINGFSRVHQGFLEKIFPDKINARTPYDTILKAIDVVSTRLRQNKGEDTKINVWITGHSLGCALASVAYARMVNEARELGPNVRVRDAYLFAAPIVCDVDSAGAFNNRMNHFSNEQNFQKTMWRVTNGQDAVACSLPDAGDHTKWSLSPWNLFSFAHLGSEIKMRSTPTKCLVTGNHITPGTDVMIESALHIDRLDPETEPLRKTLAYMQNLPLIGPIMAHAPGFYWSSLSEVAAGACEWQDEF